ncbi:sigma-54 interaction domain-containing protein [Pseudomonas gingeri]|uniref:Sigma 54-interacting transcriptional regulator n=1 Tax=Pseudomonas gingeri TaxID=117681 RepID=A0A7Y8BPE4_9PSED|nr:sigma 54-interacting transcriptional regulator [Pseudomonas gingeri]NWB83415.1 sigma 54-interacting transcriptional regulator [Pseudomonas gingeri]
MATMLINEARALVAKLAQLARAEDSVSLLQEFVCMAGQLSVCELCQLYWLDEQDSTLHLSHEYIPQFKSSSLARSFQSQAVPPLLRYVLEQGRSLYLADLDDRLHDTGFLPGSEQPWRSLLCIALPGHKQGVLVCASARRIDPTGLEEALGALGTLVLAQLPLLKSAPPTTARLPVQGTERFGMIGSSAVMQRTWRLIGKVLDNNFTVLLGGETGTGKELVARAIHEHGVRRSRAFVVQNCAAVPENLLESELFGFRKGAFTGADRDRRGLFDLADGGTLLLDEIGDLALPLQAKLLRVLQEGEIRPLGCNDSHRVDVRILAATHHDLSALVASGRFREDLYYRLAQFPIELPPLREREGDIQLLARHFAQSTCQRLLRAPLQWSHGAIEQLCAYGFPGNVRELKALVERAVLLCEGDVLLAGHFALHPGRSAPGRKSLRDRMDQIERNLLLTALRENGGNKSQVARELELPRRTLLYRMARLNIDLAQCAS